MMSQYTMQTDMDEFRGQEEYKIANDNSVSIQQEDNRLSFDNSTELTMPPEKGLRPPIAPNPMG